MALNFLGGMFSGLGTSLLSGISSSRAAKKAYKYSLDLQNRQNAFMERMSNTAHQREVKDLRKAGLNPILSATGGSGASTPSAGSSTLSPVEADLASGIATALDFKRLKNETKANESQIDLNSQLANKAQYEADNAHEASAFTNEQTRQLIQFGPQLQQAQINAQLATTAKTVQDIENSKKITNATVNNLIQQGKFYTSQVNLNTHSARQAKKQADYQDEHPFIFGLSQAAGAVPVIGGAAAVGAYGLNKFQTRHKKVGF